MSSDEAPDFELGEIERFDPRIFTEPGDDVDKFVLALGLIYNDQKNLLYLAQQLDKWAPKERTELISTYRGQWVGMRGHVARLQVGVLRELLRLLASERHVLERPEVVQCVKEMPEDAITAWNSLVSVTRNEPVSAGGPFVKFVETVRSNVGYHYQLRGLYRGYKAHFEQGATEPHRTHAMVSFGCVADQTRFYFADAAAEGFLVRCLDHSRFSDVGEYLRSTNHALRWLVDRFVRLKATTGVGTDSREFGMNEPSSLT